MKTFKYAVTWESPESKPPETIRGTIAAGSPYRALDKAAREAAKARTGRTWDNVVVLLEKMDPAVTL